MDANQLVEPAQNKEGELWYDRINNAHRTGSLCEWVSSFHPGRLRCAVADPNLRAGAYNAGFKIIFDDGAAWLVRFPRGGQVNGEYVDEKVAMEVAAINLIRSNTTIPVPKIEAWGTAAQNPLSLGPFIMMEYIKDAVSLNNLLHDEKTKTRLLTEDLGDDEIKTIYRQVAGFMLQLFKLDFDNIGNLDSPSSELHFPRRPLTWKSHDILQTGGVDTFTDPNRRFSSTTKYFQYIAEQDLEQLVRQPNSVYGPYDAAAKYRACKVLNSVIPDFVHNKYDKTNFKLICDDFGLANLMVRSRQDLTVVAVVDFEWSYIGPAQLFGSAPWWLLMDRPTNPSWDNDKDESSKIRSRYFRYLQIFKEVLEEEEARTPGHEDRELSKLIRWSEDSGAMWLHMLLSTGFIDAYAFPFAKLIEHVGAEEWKRREKEISEDEVSAFSAQKVLELEQYTRDMESV